MATYGLRPELGMIRLVAVHMMLVYSNFSTEMPLTVRAVSVAGGENRPSSTMQLIHVVSGFLLFQSSATAGAPISTHDIMPECDIPRAPNQLSAALLGESLSDFNCQVLKQVFKAYAQ